MRKNEVEIDRMAKHNFNFYRNIDRTIFFLG